MGNLQGGEGKQPKTGKSPGRGKNLIKNLSNKKSNKEAQKAAVLRKKSESQFSSVIVDVKHSLRESSDDIVSDADKEISFVSVPARSTAPVESADDSGICQAEEARSSNCGRALERLGNQNKHSASDGTNQNTDKLTPDWQTSAETAKQKASLKQPKNDLTPSSKESSSESVFTDPLTPVGFAAEINQCYYSEESVDVVEATTIKTAALVNSVPKKSGVIINNKEKLDKLSVSKVSRVSLDDNFSDNVFVVSETSATMPDASAEDAFCLANPTVEHSSIQNLNNSENNVVRNVVRLDSDQTVLQNIEEGGDRSPGMGNSQTFGIAEEQREDETNFEADKSDNVEFKLKGSNSVTSFTLSRHRKVEIPPSKVNEACLLQGADVRDHRRHSSVSDVPCGGADSNVLRKVASLTLDRATLEAKVSKPKFVPEKLDFQIYEKFEGQMLVNWFVSAFAEDHYLRMLLTGQDLRILGAQYCTHLLAAGVLRQIPDKDAPSESIFRPDLMYYWAHTEAPVAPPATPGRIQTVSWPPTQDIPHSQKPPNQLTPNSRKKKLHLPSLDTTAFKPEPLSQCEGQKNVNEAINLRLQPKEQDNKNETNESFPSSQRIRELEDLVNNLLRELDRYKTLVEIQSLTQNALRDFGTPDDDKKVDPSDGLKSLPVIEKNNVDETFGKIERAEPFYNNDGVFNEMDNSVSREISPHNLNKSYDEFCSSSKEKLTGSMEKGSSESQKALKSDSSSQSSVSPGAPLQTPEVKMSPLDVTSPSAASKIEGPPPPPMLDFNNEEYESLPPSLSIDTNNEPTSMPSISLGSDFPPPPPPMDGIEPFAPAEGVQLPPSPPMSEMCPPPPPISELGPPPPPMSGMGPPPPPMSGMVPPPPPMSGMGPPPPPMSGMGPSPPPMPGMGPPPPPMAGMGPPPPPMAGMGPPPPPMPGMGPPPPPMAGMGPPPPPMVGMGPPPPPMAGMGPPPPPMAGMGPPPPPMAGMGPPPPPMVGMSPAPPAMPGMAPPPPMGAPPPPGSAPIPFPAPPVGGWNPKKATMRKDPVNPTIPMKPLYWTRILAPPDAAPVAVVTPDESTSPETTKPLWLEIEETKLDNMDEFADLFSRQVITRKPTKKKIEKPSKAQAAKILDGKRFQNVGILAQSLHVDFSEIEHAIYNCDTTVVNLEALQQIYEARATEEELMLIKEHLKNNPDIPLDKPETFLLDLSDIQNFAERISCFTFQAEFDDSVTTIASKLDNIKRTCEFLITNEGLKKLFAIILTLGNYMNGGNWQRGQADGFGLEILAKLRDVKSKDSSVTLLHFIVRTYMAQCKEGVGAPLPIPEPGDIDRASWVLFEDVTLDLGSLEKQLNSCRFKTDKVIAASAEENMQPFKDKMTVFLKSAEKHLTLEKDNLTECQSKFLSTMKFYQFSPKSGPLEDASPKDFFILWSQFCIDFKDIWKKEEQKIIKEKLKEAKKMQEVRISNVQNEPKKEGGLKARLQKLASKKSS